MIKGKVYKVSNYSIPLFKKCYKVVTVSDPHYYQYLVLPDQQQSLTINNAKSLSLIYSDENERNSYIGLEGQCLYKYVLKRKNDPTYIFQEKEMWDFISSITIGFIQLKALNLSKYMTHFREYSVRRIQKEGCKIEYKLVFHKQMISQRQAAKLGICKWSDLYLSPQELCDKFIPQKSIVFSFGLMLLSFCSKTIKTGCLYQKGKYQLEEKEVKKRLKIAKESRKYSKNLLSFIQSCVQIDYRKRWDFLGLIQQLQFLSRLKIRYFDLFISKELQHKIDQLRIKEAQRQKAIQSEFLELDLNCESPKVLLVKPSQKTYQTKPKKQKQIQACEQTNAKTDKSSKIKENQKYLQSYISEDGQIITNNEEAEGENLQVFEEQEQNLLWNLNGNEEYSYQSEHLLNRRIFGSKDQSPRSNVSYYSEYAPFPQKQLLNNIKKGINIPKKFINESGEYNNLSVEIVGNNFIPNFPFRKAQLKLPSLLFQMQKICLSNCLKPLGQIIQSLGKAGVWAGGDIYYGSLQGKKRSGLGLEIYSNGQYYYGQFQNDSFHGQGFYFWNNQEFYFGLFEKGQKVEGRLQGPIRYQGQFRENKRHGVGTCWYETGEVYSGQWVNGKRHGAGFVIDRDGSQFEGNWYQGQRKQLGYLQNDQGRITGHWNRQNIEGECLIQYKNGDYFKGEVNEKFEKVKGVYFKNKGDNFEQISIAN